MIRKVQRADGVRYQAYSTLDGQKVYVGTARTEAEAREMLEDHRVDRRRGDIAPKQSARKTLSQAAQVWLESLKAGKSRSHGSYTVKMNLYLLPSLGALPIHRITKATVINWRDDLSRRFAPTTVNSAMTALSSAFSYFEDQGWCKANPCHDVSAVEVTERPYEWIKTKEDITRFLSACTPSIRGICTLALGTGARLDEVLHLQHADIDLEQRLITIHRGRQGTTKSGTARTVPILDVMLPFVRELALNRAGSRLVFPGEADAKTGERRARSKPGVHVPFKKALARAGLSSKIRFHDLRHTFASHWVLDGGDIFRLSKILGHADVSVTQKVYAKLIPEAWKQDYHRVGFVVPTEAKVIPLRAV